MENLKPRELSEHFASPDTEKAVLGSLMMDGSLKAMNEAASTLKPEDFSLDSHKKIYRAMLECAELGAKPDDTMLIEKLGGFEGIKTIGGIGYLSDLTNWRLTPKNLTHYIDIVRDKSRARMLLEMHNLGRIKLEQGESPADVISQAQEHLIHIVRHGKSGKLLPIDDIVRESLHELELIREMSGECIGLSTGLDELDAVTTGFRESEFYVIGARPGQGKTAFACQTIRKNCREGRKVALFSIEVKRTQIIHRLMAMESKVSVFDLRDPRVLSRDAMHRVYMAGADVAKWPLMIDDTPSLDLSEMLSTARLFISQGAELIIVDFLQKMKAKGRDRFEKVTAIANGLWELGRATGVPVVALSQLKRKQNADDEPTMEDLRESGEIEQNANAVFLLFRPKEVDAADPEKRKVFTGRDQIIIPKQRSGPAGIYLPVEFDGPRGMFNPRVELR